MKTYAASQGETHYSYCFKDGQTEAEITALLERKNQYFLEVVARLTAADLLPGVEPLLLELKKRGFKIALASSSRNVKPIIGNLGVAGFFDFTADGSCVKKAKPAPDLFLFAANGLGEAPANCLVIEDATAGVAAAHAAGMLAVGIGPVERVGKADFRYDSMAELDLAEILNNF